MTEKEAMEALGRIDQVISQVSMPRPNHVQLVQDVQVVQERVKLSYVLEEAAANANNETPPGE